MQRPISLLTSRSYSFTATLLHWVLAVAIIATFFVGLQMVDMKTSVFKLQIFSWRKWAGLSVLALMAAF